MTRAQLTQQILSAKRRHRLTFTEIARRIGRDRVWTTAALLGQHPFDADSAAALVDLLELEGAEVTALLTEVPMRGALESPVPTDPTIYRLYEVLQVYGPAFKELIHEDFGDGIMSAISFNADITRVEHEDGDRVRITLDGKFLPYKW
ncbi:MAG: cyanase [Solirubrobacteraceae bacterium]